MLRRFEFASDGKYTHNGCPKIHPLLNELIERCFSKAHSLNKASKGFIRLVSQHAYHMSSLVASELDAKWSGRSKMGYDRATDLGTCQNLNSNRGYAGFLASFRIVTTLHLDIHRVASFWGLVRTRMDDKWGLWIYNALPNLKHLRIDKYDELYFLWPFDATGMASCTFPHLRSLRLGHCRYIVRLELTSPHLVELELRGISYEWINMADVQGLTRLTKLSFSPHDVASTERCGLNPCSGPMLNIGNLYHSDHASRYLRSMTLLNYSTLSLLANLQWLELAQCSRPVVDLRFL